MKKMIALLLVCACGWTVQAQETTPVKPKSDFVLACSDEKPSVGFVVRELTDNPDVIVAELFLFLQGQEVTNAKIKALPSYLRFEWPRSQCKSLRPFVLSCKGAVAPTVYEGATIRAHGFDTVLFQEIWTTGLLRGVRAFLNLEVNGEALNVPMMYTSEFCTDQATF
ncbi:MAG: hypothetical protein AAGB31_14215 [Bdellovibrio sp.]